jgi:hypothetical protein
LNSPLPRAVSLRLPGSRGPDIIAGPSGENRDYYNDNNDNSTDQHQFFFFHGNLTNISFTYPGINNYLKWQKSDFETNS